MSLHKRSNTWWIDFAAPDGTRIRKSSGTDNRVLAQELHDRMKAESWRKAKLGTKPAHTWDEAVDKFLDETEMKHVRCELARLRWLKPFLTGKLLHQIDREQIRIIGEQKKQETSATTANRHLQLIRAILRKAQREWQWVDTVPVIRLYKEPEGRVRWITPMQVEKLLRELPEHQREMTLFALATGLRQANVRDLTWAQVDLTRRVAWIKGSQFKNGNAHGFPLNDIAFDVLHRNWGKHPTHVFTYQGHPITNVNTKAWRKALKRAGIDDFRWHDLRHTWASLLRQNGVSLGIIKEMGGWKTFAMVDRYAHVSAAHLAPHARVIDDQLGMALKKEG